MQTIRLGKLTQLFLCLFFYLNYSNGLARNIKTIFLSLFGEFIKRLGKKKENICQWIMVERSIMKSITNVINSLWWQGIAWKGSKLRLYCCRLGNHRVFIRQSGTGDQFSREESRESAKIPGAPDLAPIRVLVDVPQSVFDMHIGLRDASPRRN